MPELSKIIEPWLVQHGYSVTAGVPSMDFVDREVDGRLKTIGWIWPTFVEVGVKLRLYRAPEQLLATWADEPQVKLDISDPNFFEKLLVALENATEEIMKYQARVYGISYGKLNKITVK